MSATSVYLGTCFDEYEVVDKYSWDQNKIGGSPVWLTKKLHPKCSECSGDVLFVGQLYCPIDNLNNRVFFIFTCAQEKCILNGKNWSVTRCQKIKETSNPQEIVTKVESVFDEFSFDNLDWQTENDDCVLVDSSEIPQQTKDTSIENKVIEDFDGLAVSDAVDDRTSALDHTLRQHKMNKTSIRGEADFKFFYIEVFIEPNESHDFSHESEILREYLKKEKISLEDIESAKKSASTKSGDGKLEPYEKNLLRAEYKWQGKFSKRVKNCPNQILRYAYNDQALFFNAPIPTEKILPCSCGAERIFEFQLMPALQNYLVPPTGLEAPRVDLGCFCVFVFTCSKSCHVEDMPEQVVVQLDV